jgi:hypothetical protein
MSVVAKYQTPETVPDDYRLHSMELYSKGHLTYNDLIQDLYRPRNLPVLYEEVSVTNADGPVVSGRPPSKLIVVEKTPKRSPNPKKPPHVPTDLELSRAVERQLIEAERRMFTEPSEIVRGPALCPAPKPKVTICTCGHPKDEHSDVLGGAPCLSCGDCVFYDEPVDLHRRVANAPDFNWSRTARTIVFTLLQLVIFIVVIHYMGAMQW